MIALQETRCPLVESRLRPGRERSLHVGHRAGLRYRQSWRRRVEQKGLKGRLRLAAGVRVCL